LTTDQKVSGLNPDGVTKSTQFTLCGLFYLERWKLVFISEQIKKNSTAKAVQGF